MKDIKVNGSNESGNTENESMSRRIINDCCPKKFKFEFCGRGKIMERKIVHDALSHLLILADAVL